MDDYVLCRSARLIYNINIVTKAVLPSRSVNLSGFHMKENISSF